MPDDNADESTIIHTPSKTEVAAELGLMAVHIPASLRKIKEIGDNMDLVGIANVYKGSVLMSIDGARKVETILLRAMTDNAMTPEELAAVANAYAGMLKSKAALIKATGESMPNLNKPQRGRRSFAKGEKIGPLLDVTKPA